MYADDMADVYDLLYSEKDYAAESATVADLIRERVPRASSLLDVACGSGLHLARFRAAFDRVAGVELSADMAGYARRRVPGVSVAVGDMRDFDLGERFDAVVCLFSSIGYVLDIPGLHAAVNRMAAHVAPGGVLVVEAFHTPEEFLDGHHSAAVVRDGRSTLTRLSVSTHKGTTGVMDMHFVWARGKEVLRFSESHELALFTDADLRGAFAAAGLVDTERVADVLTGRGLYVGAKPA